MNMKNIRNIISGMLALLFVTTILGSCQTDDYLVEDVYKRQGWE